VEHACEGCQPTDTEDRKRDTSQSGDDGKYETINGLAAGVRGEVDSTPLYVYGTVTTHSYLPTSALPTAAEL